MIRSKIKSSQCECQCHVEESGLEILKAVAVIVVVVIQFFAFAEGCINNGTEVCRTFPKTRADILIPTAWVGCKTGEFFSKELKP